VPPGPATITANSSNRFALDYAAAASRFASLGYPIIDVHSHIHGPGAARMYAEVARLFGVGLTYSMTPLREVDAVAEALEGRIRFIAMPDFMAPDRREAHGAGFLRTIEGFHARGARIVKFWAAPRGIDLGAQAGDPDLLRLDAPARIEAMHLASSLGMTFMTHVADPDTWFATRYADRARYGSKRSHYDPLERLIERFPRPWIAAHLGGWPEDLEFLDGLLGRHRSLHLDCSACKWMVRELGRHGRDEVVDFLRRWQGRILFGSDIVTSDEHLRAGENKNEMAAKSSSSDEAWDLYASRYWAYRTMLETDHDGESPIADPDLAMVDPVRFTPMDGPRLRGLSLPPDLLRSLYHDAAVSLIGEDPATLALTARPAATPPPVPPPVPPT